jgi:hypothetical protein
VGVDDLAKPSRTLHTTFVGRSSSPRVQVTALRQRQAEGTFFSWELGDVKGFDVILESIMRLLISHNHVFDDASKGSDRATPIFRNAVKIQFNFRTKRFVH